MWFDTWSDVLRVLLVGVAAYLSLLVLIRISGKRTLAQFNAFDLVVTVALGSTLATILLTSDVSFVEGAVALALLLGLQVLIALAVTFSRPLRRAITAQPTLLVWEGRLDASAMRAHRVSRGDVLQAIRQGGHGDLADVGAVILESNGRISVIAAGAIGDGSSLEGLLPHE
ncbi:DUF421 domain-containing protein [Microbacterium koreense]|uniref:DUF421 domain-containing protein n=1 Tax=Microbacterium koreense TaxID=323761 RepID=A0ABW2ZRK1_9MICO